MLGELLPPIVVEVKDGRYDCYSIHEEPSTRDISLLAVLQEMGGVAEGTVPGVYTFNVEHLDAETIVAHLEPVSKEVLQGLITTEGES